MGYRLREIGTESKFSEELSLDALSQVVPSETIKAVLEAEGIVAERERKLNMVTTVVVIIGMSLFSQLGIGAVMAKIAKGLRYVWPDPEYRLPGKSALNYRRYQVGARPLVRLFHAVCRPMTTPKTQGAFLKGLRLMALDGSVEEAADTAENSAYFGRQVADRGASAFPQIQAVYLAECGTRAVVDVGFWPYQTSERVGGFRLLRSVGPDMLLMWDRGFHDYDMFVLTHQRGAHVLARLPAYARPKHVHTLPDGSSLAYIYPSDYKRRRAGEHLLVRIITYTITDSALPGCGETHRLISTLVDWRTFPALELACAYHERWEIELLIDETDCHQRLAGRPLRSKKPVGVIQELYGLLIAHYAVRFLIHQAALEADLDPDRLSFSHALEVIRDAIPEFQMTDPLQRPALLARLLRDIAARPLPPRRLRSYPRVVKRKMSNFRLKRPEHYRCTRPSVHFFRQAVALI